jgi:hypothetical protein
MHDLIQGKDKIHDHRSKSIVFLCVIKCVLQFLFWNVVQILILILSSFSKSPINTTTDPVFTGVAAECRLASKGLLDALRDLKGLVWGCEVAGELNGSAVPRKSTENSTDVMLRACDPPSAVTKRPNVGSVSLLNTRNVF